ncbi:MAG: rhomboid family intramembrane serine protease [Hydrogenophaga sp.]|uniref:rhomboid family intramembrane serine protease n=1 Tax=Hydrogenophaga sp. TaxID=1904254 RepID=UPI003D9B90E5
MDERLPDGSQVFRASWRGGITWLAGFSLALGLLMAWWALDDRGAPVALWGFAAFFGGMGLLLFKPVLSRLPVLSVGPQGVSGQLTRGHTMPWSDITDVEHHTVQGQELITLVLRAGSPLLAPTKPLIGGGLKRSLSLQPLRKAERARAADAVQRAFQRHAGAQAQRAAQALLAEWQAEGDFEQRLRDKTPSLWALYAVVALNVGVWIANLVDGLNPLQPATADLFRWGASSASAVVRDGDYWRLITATVLHGGLMHLALNMYALWVAGLQVCRWFGNGPFLLIYWGSALAGSALSLHFSAQQAVSVGASGAVFGVLGALLAGVWQHRERVPKAVVTQLLTSQGLFVAISLAQGFTRPGIDNAAHIGGLLAGAAMAWLLVELVDEQASAEQRRRRQWLATGVVALAVGGLVASAAPGVDHRALFEQQTVLREVLPRLQAAESALQRDARAQQAGQMSEAQLIDAMERTHIPAYRAVGEAMARVQPAAPSPQLDDLRGLQSGVLELMTLEVGKARGTLDPAQADQRAGVVSARLADLGQRLRARNGDAGAD